MECSVGIFLDEPCHKNAYGESKKIRQINELEEDDKLLLQVRLNNRTFECICDYHSAKMLQKYNHLFGNCCSDPFLIHKKGIRKSLREITIEKYNEAKVKNITIIPGKSLCTNCWTRISDLSCASDSSDLDYEPKSQTIENVNIACQLLGESPLKVAKLSSDKRMTTITRKVEKVSKSLGKKLSTSFDVPYVEEDLFGKVVKLDEYSILINKLKEKMKQATSIKDKIKILSLLPSSWSKEKVMAEFGVSEYVVKSTRKLVKKYGILPEKYNRKEKPFSKTVSHTVIEFYENDDNSRICPGKKDFVSVRTEDGTKIHKQKQLILCNLKELYSKFKSVHPSLCIGFSKFAQLRPKWCILAGPKGTHNVCVCMSHQNVKLMVSAVRSGSFSYKELLQLLTCDLNNEKCMFNKCELCPTGKEVKQVLCKNEEETADEDDDIADDCDYEIKYHQWVTVDRCELVTVCKPYNEFIDKLIDNLSSLKKHHFIAKKQAEYLSLKKEGLTFNEFLVVGDFSENFTFQIQDEIQSYHWVNSQATIHPFVAYFKSDMENEVTIKCKCFCVISNCLNHTTESVYCFQAHLITELLKLNTHIEKVTYFSDGCAAQYKNRKNFINLCHHKTDFGIDAEWHFFATSHGKNACDGIGGTVKRIVSKASLQRVNAEPITTPLQMFDYCSANITGIHFLYVSEEDIEDKKEMLLHRFSRAKVIPNTRDSHAFIPISETKIKVSTTSLSEDHQVCFVQDEYKTLDVKLKDYVACVYDSQWWLGKVEDISPDQSEYFIMFFHPAGPNTSFKLASSDQVWVTKKDILRVVSPIELFLATTGRCHNIDPKLSEELSILLFKHLGK